MSNDKFEKFQELMDLRLHNASYDMIRNHVANIKKYELRDLSLFLELWSSCEWDLRSFNQRIREFAKEFSDINGLKDRIQVEKDRSESLFGWLKQRIAPDAITYSRDLLELLIENIEHDFKNSEGDREKTVKFGLKFRMIAEYTHNPGCYHYGAKYTPKREPRGWV